MNIYEKWLSVNQRIKDLQKEKLSIEINLYERNKSELSKKDEGSTKIESGKFLMTVTRGYTFKVDQELASVIDFGFKKKYELDKTMYKKLDPDTKRRVDEALETKIKKPSFKVEMV